MPVYLPPNIGQDKATRQRTNRVKGADHAAAYAEVSNKVLDKNRDGVSLSGAGHDVAQATCNQDDPAIKERSAVDYPARSHGCFCCLQHSGFLLKFVPTEGLRETGSLAR